MLCGACLDFLTSKLWALKHSPPDKHTPYNHKHFLSLEHYAESMGPVDHYGSSTNLVMPTCSTSAVVKLWLDL